MTDVAKIALAYLQRIGVSLEPGLSDEDLRRVEERFAITFGPDQRELLRLAVPVGDLWFDWRTETDRINEALAWPTEGAIFDVHQNGFWPRSWGPKPDDPKESERVARRHLSMVPTLIPLYAHRYLPASPAPSGAPVFSVCQTDVIYYGDNLADYVAREFKLPEAGRGDNRRVHVPFWSDLADDGGSAGL